MTPSEFAGTVLSGLLLVNIAAYLAFAHDKMQARRGGWRVRESTLLGLALFGGSAGARLAQQLLRHKARKQPFATVLNGILILHLAIAVALPFALPTIGSALAPAGGVRHARESARPTPRYFGPKSF